MDEAIRAMEAARLRFEQESEALAAQRALAELAQRQAELAELEAVAAQRDFAERLHSLMAIKEAYDAGEGILHITFVQHHFACAVLAMSFADSLGDAPNYVETSFITDKGPIVVTVQRRDGKRPADVVGEMREVMREMLAAAGAVCPWCGDEHGQHGERCPVPRAAALCVVPKVPGGED